MNKFLIYFEKFSAFVFLGILVALILFLTSHPISNDSKDAVLMVIGALTAASTTAIPKLFSTDESRIKKLEETIMNLKKELQMSDVRYETVKHTYDNLLHNIVAFYMKKTTENMEIPPFFEDLEK